MGLAINGLAHHLEVGGGDDDDRVGVRVKDLMVDDVCAAGGEGGQDADQGRPHHAQGPRHHPAPQPGVQTGVHAGKGN